MKPYKPKGSNNYYVKLKSWDAAAGQWVWKKVSTGTDDLAAAEGLYKALSQAAEGAAALSGKSVPRSHIEAVIRGVYALAGVGMEDCQKWPRIHDYVTAYLEAREPRVTKRTMSTYRTFKNTFLGAVPKDAALDWLTPARASAWYEKLLTRLTAKTASERARFVSRVYARAQQELDYPANPIRGVEFTSKGEKLERLPFTLEEVHALVKHLQAGTEREQEWSRAVMLSAMTGARLEDAVTAKSGQIRDGVFTYRQHKTGKKLSVPLVVPAWREALESCQGRVCPTLASAHTTSATHNMSQEFTGLVSDAGIEQKWKTFRSGRRVARKSFHSLRHTLRTLIVSSGGSDAQADLILGHSGQQGKTYTHSELESLQSVLVKAIS